MQVQLRELSGKHELQLQELQRALVEARLQSAAHEDEEQAMLDLHDEVQRIYCLHWQQQETTLPALAAAGGCTAYIHTSSSRLHCLHPHQ